jgi:LmbE family N-acetylglucosaminyl deacetylase
MKKRILAIVAHPDDEIIGCGGSLIKHVNSGDKVKIVFASDCEARKVLGKVVKKNSPKFRFDIAKKVSLTLKFEAPTFLNYPNLTMDRNDLLNLNTDIQKIINSYKPHIIYTHFFGDMHHDHRSVYEATLVSCKSQYYSFIEKILMFEIPSATDCFFNNENSLNFNPNIFVNIEKEMKKKKKSLELYKDEILDYPNSRSFKGLENLSMYRGNSLKFKNAEAFQLVWEKIN